MPDHSEFTKVKATVVMDGKNIALTPSDPPSREQIKSILGDKDRHSWHFMGSLYTPDEGLFIGVKFACGGEIYDKREGNIFSIDYKDAIKVYLDVNGSEDMEACDAVFNFGYFSYGMVVLDGSTADRVVLAPSAKCNVCDGPLVKCIELEWRVCDPCRKICEHKYKWEVVGRVNGYPAWLPFCTKCGRGDSNWEPNNGRIEYIIRMLNEPGGLYALAIRHEDGEGVLSRNRE